MSKFNEMSLSLLFYLIDSGELKPSQLLEACLERISLRDPEVLAFTTLNSENSMESAKILDTETPDNALFGIPVGIKDIMDTTDMPTTRGSPLYEGYYPIRDAALRGKLYLCWCNHSRQDRNYRIRILQTR